MPELPEVETIKEALKKNVEGALIRQVEVHCRSLRIPVPLCFEKTLAGCRITKVRRVAKYVIMDLDNGKSIVWHFGMSGKIKITDVLPSVPEKHDHVIIATSHGFVIFNDPRRFGLMTVIKTTDADACPLFRHIGPDPFDNKLDATYLETRLRHKKTPIKIALLDQSLIAGIGNIYASEALYLARISPLRPSSSLTFSEISALLEAIRLTLKKAIKAGGSTLRDYRKPDGSMGYFQYQHSVYGKEGQPCPDCPLQKCPDGGIKKIVQGGRSTFYCNHLQK